VPAGPACATEVLLLLFGQIWAAASLAAPTGVISADLERMFGLAIQE
jgi:hypothetical protein